MFEDITPESIKKDILSEIDAMDTREGAFCSTLVAPVSTKMWEVLQSLNAVIPIAFVDETSGQYIDLAAKDYGIVRKSGTKATADVTFEGKEGTVISAGNVFVSTDGYEYILDETVTIDASGTAVGSVTALEVGEEYNNSINTITGQYKVITGLNSVTNHTAALGGTDAESDISLLERYHERLRIPATSGNVYHYMRWAKEVAGVGDAKVFPLWNGNGTVKVVICSSEGLSCNEDAVAECAAYIEAQRPIGATVTVESAVEKEINVTAVLSIDGSRTIEDISEEITGKIETYLKSLAFSVSTLLYNQIGYLILGTEGVIDYTSLTINAGTSNIAIAENEIAVTGAVNVSV